MRTEDLLFGTPYHSYSYAYPHKTAYRHFEQPLPLKQVWANEARDGMFLYMHIPFCEMRCGFCNLFTIANPQGNIVDAYLDTLTHEARRSAAALGPRQFARLAIGGGTPTFLSAKQLERLFDLAEELGAQASQIPTSVETSPHTATSDRLKVLRERGVDRISMGIQSFDEQEAAAAGRPQRRSDVALALTNIRKVGFPTLNIDLIYGIAGQTVVSWLNSLKQALRYKPEELYLYPLYVRPLTGLGQHDRNAISQADWDKQRLELYRAGREFLLDAGYTQTSMRMFRAPHAPQADGPSYCCQDDGMLGLGCGARSYTRGLHYSSEYAVARPGVRAILSDYIKRDPESFAFAHYGMALDEAEQQRRYVIQSLLQVEGLDRAAYRTRFASDALSDLPQLNLLVEHELATVNTERIILSEAGIARSDAIGPWLNSQAVQERMQDFVLR
jgi:oxygen-independent coproporphyrinogen-3 oxidase